MPEKRPRVLFLRGAAGDAASTVERSPYSTCHVWPGRVERYFARIVSRSSTPSARPKATKVK